jgi:hypothetical protein
MNPFMRSLVPFMLRGSRRRFLGTGIVVSPNTILTCAHVFASGHSSFFDKTFSKDDLYTAGEVSVVDGTRTYEPLRICCSQVPNQCGDAVFFGDFCCVHFEKLPDLIPARLCRSRSLKGHELHAAGFTSELLGPAARYIRGVEIVHGEHDAGTEAVQYVQVKGGVPEGFSGGAVFAGDEGLVVVGMLQLGGRTSATSRFVAVDRLVEFLASQCPGIAFGACDEYKNSGPPAPPPGGVHQNVQTGNISGGSRVVISQVAKGRG